MVNPHSAHISSAETIRATSLSPQQHNELRANALYAFKSDEARDVGTLAMMGMSPEDISTMCNVPQDYVAGVNGMVERRVQRQGRSLVRRIAKQKAAHLDKLSDNS